MTEDSKMLKEIHEALFPKKKQAKTWEEKVAEEVERMKVKDLKRLLKNKSK